MTDNSTMKRVTLTENQGGDIPVALVPDDAVALNQSGLLQALPMPGIQRDQWTLVPCPNRVGAIRVGSLDIIVRPKAKFSSLLFMLAYAHDQGFKPTEFDGTGDDELWPTIGETLIRLTKRALEGGVLRGYVTKDDRLPVVRGRIRVSEQLRRHQGIPLPLEVRYSDFSSDTPENRILRTALRRMASVPRLPDSIAQNIHHFENRLSGATLLEAGAPRPVWLPSKLNVRYVPALRLAELVLDSIGLTTVRGEPDQPMASFVVNMATIFEAFVTTALREALFTVSTGLTREQYPAFLDDDKRFPIRPDVVHFINDRPRAVYDAKYKLEETLGDLYQMFAYCTVLGLNTGHLVYAGSRFDGDEPDVVVRNSGITIRIHPLDVTLNPGRLLTQIQKIAQETMKEAGNRRSLSPTDSLDLPVLNHPVALLV